MNPRERFARQCDVFDRVCGVDAGERGRVLESECGGDVELRAAVESLLAADDSVSGWLDDGKVEALAVERISEALREEEEAGPCPETIGAYRIVGVLGSGGTGIVYRARQLHPRREVALKVLRYGAMSPEMIRRFEFEANVVARLQHPGIAQVYEAGTWDDGGGPRPYFAMELVEGVRLSSFAHGMDDRAKLSLFVQVCRAVEHAHQKGVIHRDLKPDNILVVSGSVPASNGAVGHATGGAAGLFPKIVDFGIARAADVPVTAATIGQGLAGTLPYMSPEQVCGKDVDTRTDVYALGVVLYELLSGTTPLDVRGKSIPEAMRIIVEIEPPPLRRTQDRWAGDLDTIAAKAMRKECDLRYPSAGALADDIERHLRDEPISARRATRIEHWRRFARRNTAVAASMVLALVSLLSATGISTWMAWREHLASERAKHDAGRALNQADRAERIKKVMIGMFAPLYPARPSSKVTVEQMLTQATRQIRTELVDQPDLAEEVLFVLGTIYQNLDLPQHAAPLLEDLLTRQRAGGAPTDEYLATLDLLGNVYNRDRDYQRAAACFREVLDRRIETDGLASTRSIDALNALAHVLMWAGDLDEAIRLRRQALALLDELGENRPTLRYAATLGLGVALALQGCELEAERTFRSILQLPQRAHDFWTNYYLADLLVTCGAANEALVILEPMLTRMRPQREGEPRRLGLLLGVRSRALEAAGAVVEAETAAREALDVLESIDAATLPVAFERLASTLHRQGRDDEAYRMIERALEALRGPRRKTVDEAHILDIKARILAQQGDIGAARASADEALAIMRRAYPLGHMKLAQPLITVAEVEVRAGRPQLALALLRDVVPMLAMCEPAHPLRIALEKAIAAAQTAATDSANARAQ